MSTPKTITPSLLKLSPAEVNALPPDQRKEWSRQNKEYTSDFGYLMGVVDDLYPVCRRYFKGQRAAHYFDDNSKNTDVHLSKAFRLLLGFAEEIAEDPEFLARFRTLVPKFKASAKRIACRRKETAKSKEAAKRAAKGVERASV
jgi:hypothetical protein